MKTSIFNLKNALAIVAINALGILSVNAQTNTFPANGKVGLGTTAPEFPVHQVTSHGSGLVLDGTGTGWAGMIIRGKSANTRPYYQYETLNNKAAFTYMNTSGDFILNVGGTSTTTGVDRFSVRSTGHVYINTGSFNGNDAALKVSGSLEIPLASVGQGNPNQQHYSMLKLGPFQLSSGTNTALPLGAMSFARTGSGLGSIMVFDAQNRVGIGTSSPTSLLSVNGTITAEEIVVQDVGADYVFDENYKLKSLTEVEAFVKTNKHLPGIAPACETEKGIKVGEFNEKLLEKIEELTLYMIDLKKQNDQLTQEVGLLKKK